MIYLLAILWFASGFFSCVYYNIKILRIDFIVIDILPAICWGFGGIFCIWFLLPTKQFLEITLFKARNK